MTNSSALDTAPLRRAFSSTRAVLAEVRTDQLAAPTPCASWDVSALIAHFIGSARWIADVVRGTEPSGARNYAASEHLDAYDDSGRAALAALDDIEDAGVAVFGGLSAAGLLAMSTQDQFVHGWDLARATGQSTDLDPDLAGALLAAARNWVDDKYRGPDGVGLFGPSVEAPATATPADRLAAFLGRSL
ncbi:TIGR03086 family metal-binding protein [Nocardia barduliensis]|uniref:TIGR03086 family metal-binding protein n=1 Tax=Nocardia barduliensis TaxID=2736643 RepID=UPI001574AAE7|nr:TIGR03086 family metal-binding protein [Nocardia barduliensis]